ncbi:hypothetical protein CVT24_006562 [Panaeolus cyanescens]|uniref:Transmembrane protein n=1 Tax=Panaeolus cyanescens TaxID=181874 RepID=A0A409WNS8_9AGAR|nr:hypothetical protein CVT24_006562 [Panaeolus cyanescens]
MSNEVGVVILDDLSPNITYGEQPWTIVTIDVWSGGSCQFPEFSGDLNSNVTGSLNLTFDGTSIAFIGNTPPRAVSQTAMISIDNTPAYESGFDDPTPQTYKQWYQSPTLSEGLHFISLTQLRVVALDMILITIGANTPLNGKTLFIDNEDPQISYSGQWRQNREGFQPIGLPPGIPIHNSTHRTENIGDSITFRFTGTSVNVYGIFDWRNIGRIDAAYNIDGSIVKRSHISTEASRERAAGEQTNFVYYSKQGLEPGPHVLVISIVNITNMRYSLDYITYTPSFSNLASRPDIRNLTLPNSGTDPNPVPTFTSSGSGSSQDPKTGSTNRSPGEVQVGAIVGGILGSLALLFVLFMFLWYRRNIQYISDSHVVANFVRLALRILERMASGVVILDDASGQITYSGGTWTLAADIQWYQASSYWPQFTDGVSRFGSFALTFEGRSIAFIGNTPPNGLSQEATISIDGGSVSTVDYGDPTPQTYMQWYQSPNLADGRHRISVGHLAGTSLDMALITIGPNTPLSGKTLLIDDDDSQISYSGSWVKNTNKFDAGTLPDGYPIRGSTHRSSNVGDSLTFRFTGTSVAIYGIFNWRNTGSLTATYTLDGNSDTQVYTVNQDTPYHVNNYGEASNFVFFRRGSLSAGAHTLVVTITQSQNIAYNFDYITYTPSFSNLASRPNLGSLPQPSQPPSSSDPTPMSNAPPSAGSLGSNSASSPSISSNTVVPTSNLSQDGSKPNTIISQGSSSNSTSAAVGGSLPGPTINAASASSFNRGGSSPPPVGAIVGGVLGSLALLAFLAVFTVVRKRSRKRSDIIQDEMVRQPQTNTSMTEHVSSGATSNLSPFVGHTSAGYALKGDRSQAWQPPLTSTSSPMTQSSSHHALGRGSGLYSENEQHVMEVDAGPVVWPPAYNTIPGNARGLRSPRASEAQNANPFDDKEVV